VPAATGQGAHRSSEYSSTRLRVSFVGRPQCHAAVRALRFHGPCAFGIGVMALAASCAFGRPHRRYRSTSEVPSSVHSAPCAAAAPRAEAPEVSASVQTMLSPFHLGRSHLGRSHLGHSHLGRSHLGRSHLRHSHLGHSYLGHSHLGRSVCVCSKRRPRSSRTSRMQARSRRAMPKRPCQADTMHATLSARRGKCASHTRVRARWPTLQRSAGVRARTG
jgi:hypothetical protein